MRARLSVGVVVACFALGVPVASGQTARDPAAAEVLFNSGKDLLKQGDWAGACAKFQASMDLDPAVATLLKIAKCREHEGKLAAAWYDYQRALGLNQETKDEGPERKRELEEFTRKAISAIEPRIPKLRVVVNGRPAGLRVTRDGRDLPLSTLGEALPVDPGPHEIVVEAPGHRSVRRKVALAEKQSSEVVVDLVAVAAPPPLPPAAQPIARGAEAKGRAQRVAGIVVGSAGIVTLGVAAAFGIDTLLKVGDSDPHCFAAGCNKTGVRLLTDAGSSQTTGFVLLAAGAVVAGAGAAIYFTAPKSAPRAPEVGASVSLGGVSLLGRW